VLHVIKTKDYACGNSEGSFLLEAIQAASSIRRQQWCTDGYDMT
jgi:hypothetical protein